MNKCQNFSPTIILVKQNKNNYRERINLKEYLIKIFMSRIILIIKKIHILVKKLLLLKINQKLMYLKIKRLINVTNLVKLYIIQIIC